MEEASMPLVPTERFSLVNCSSLEDFIDNHHQTYEDSSSSSIEKDPILPASRRFFRESSSSFKFVSLSDENHSLVYADELFRDGYIVPYRSKATSAGTHEESEALDTKIETRGGVNSNTSPSCKKLRKVSKWALLKYLNCLTPFCRRSRRCCTSASRIRVTTSSRIRVYSDETTSPAKNY